MPQKPPFYRQETDYTCVSACLRMLMESFGVLASEADIHIATGGDEGGVTVTGLIKAASSFGFTRTKEIRLIQPEPEIFEELDALTQSHYPLAYLKLLNGYHAVIILGIDGQEVFLLDPLVGECGLTRSLFLFQWNNANRRLIVIQR